MKNTIATLFALLIVYGVEAQNTIVGRWEGKLNAGAVSLRIVLHIDGAPGAYTATMDSPDQGAKGIQVSKVEVKEDSLLLEVMAIGGKLTGRITNDTIFNGQWMQGGVNLPLDLKKAQGEQNINEPARPQTPKPPFSYESNNIVYYNKDNSTQFGATITKPKGNGPFPALLLLTGSGQQNRDEEIFGHKPFAVIADYLTRKGFLVMRVDDRGMGQTTGDVKNATTKDFADDAMVGLDYLKTLPHVDKTKMGLLGHSEGGMIAQMTAAQRRDINFVVWLAAPGTPIIDLMTEQNKAVLQTTGMNADAIENYLRLYKPLVTAIAFAPTDEAIRNETLKVLNNWIANTPKNIVATTTGITDEASKQKFISDFSKQAGSPWFRYFLRYKPDVYVRKINAKVLALNGDKDIQVNSKSNLAALKISLQKSPSKKFDVMELPGLNHLFQHCTKCTVAEYAELEETISPKVLETIATWLAENVR